VSSLPAPRTRGALGAPAPSLARLAPDRAACRIPALRCSTRAHAGARVHTHPTRRRTCSPRAPEPVAHMPTPMSVSVSNRRYPKTFDRRLGGRPWKAHPSRQAPLPQAARPAAHTSGEAAGAKCQKGTVGPRSCVVHPIVKVYVEAIAPAFGKSRPVFRKPRFSCGTRRRYSPRIAFAIAALGPRIIWCAWPRLPDCLAAHAAEPFPLA
jgi:hypothetical protein